MKRYEKNDINSERVSFTAADSYPLKVLLDKDVVENAQKNKKIIPVHIQLNPENKCNLNCPFCSCANRNRSEQLSLEKCVDIMKMFKSLGGKSVTLTGGGEPLLHPKINEIITEIKDLGYEIGLVSNGTVMKKLEPKTLSQLTWCRVSFSDFRKFDNKFISNIDYIIENAPDLDMAFSYVLTESINFKNLIGIIKYANEHSFTHVRIVSDLLNLDNIMSMEEIREKIQGEVDDRIVLYQGRKEPTKGTKYCYISLLKPLVGANGQVYPCCGTQYAEEDPTLDYGENMNMGSVDEFEERFNNQDFFDGRICAKCYYQKYNEVLGALLSDIKHKEFL